MSVTKLPTAAPRKVQQNLSAVRAARAVKSSKFGWVHPFDREQQKLKAEREAIMSNVTQTPELAIILCVLTVLPIEQIEAALIVADKFGPDDEIAQAAKLLMTEALEKRRHIQRLAEMAVGGRS